MKTHAAVVLDEDLRIPAEVCSFQEFREWSRSDQFPERGRIDYLQGEVEVDLSPEDLYTHGVVKTAIAAAFFGLLEPDDLGSVFVDRTRVVSPEAGLSVEPDVVVVLWPSIESGRVREVPASGADEGRFIELAGAPDLVVEIISDRSVKKDRERLPALYARAGVPELWTVDARGPVVLFEIRSLSGSEYQVRKPEAESWIFSSVLGRRCRLTRRRTRHARWAYKLELSPPPGS